MILQAQSLILSLQQQLLRPLHAVAVGNLSGTLVAQAIVHRCRVTQIRQTTGPLQQRVVVLIAGEEAALVERQVRAAPAARQAESIGASAATRVERSTAAASGVGGLLIQTQVAPRSHEVLLVAVLREATTSAAHVTVTRAAKPSLLLLRGGPDVALNSRASSSSEASSTARTTAAVALRAAGLPVERPGLFLFLLFLHLYDLILKGRKRALFNESVWHAVHTACGVWWVV